MFKKKKRKIFSGFFVISGNLKRRLVFGRKVRLLLKEKNKAHVSFKSFFLKSESFFDDEIFCGSETSQYVKEKINREFVSSGERKHLFFTWRLKKLLILSS